MRRSNKKIWSIVILIFCFPVLGNDITIEKKFSRQYMDNKKQIHSIHFCEVFQTSGRGPKHIIVTNEHCNYSKLDFKMLRSDKKSDAGIIKNIILDSHPFPSLRSSYHGIPVITEYGFNEDADFVWCVIGNYGEAIRLWIFSKDKEGIYSVPSESKWPASFIKNCSQRYQILWHNNVIFLLQKQTMDTIEELLGVRLLGAGIIDPITPLMPIFYPYCPSEIAFFYDDKKQIESSNPFFKLPSELIGVSINGNLLTSKDIEKYINRYLQISKTAEYSVNELIFSFVIASIMEDYYFSESKVHPFKFDIQKKFHHFLKIKNLPQDITSYNYNFNNINHKIIASEFVRNNKTESFKISDDELKNLFEKTKDIFRKKFVRESDIYQYDEVKSFLQQQTKRLKYYGMSKLLEIPLKVELIWLSP
jgi:hypothetical protein